MSNDTPVAIITGAAGGIGRAVAERFTESGVRSIIVDIRGDNAALVASELRASSGTETLGLGVDITNPDSVAHMVSAVRSAFGRIDHLVNCAGMSETIATKDQTVDGWRRVLDLNLTGTFLCCREVHDSLAETDGSIVNIASVTGSMATRPEVHAAYDASKSAVVALTRTLGAEWATDGIRVNAVSPGYTNTQMLQTVGSEHPEVLAAWIDQIPQHRLIEPSEIAEVVYFLASRRASAMTGTTVSVDGGYLATK